MTDKAYPELPKAHLPRGGFPDLFTADQLAAAVAVGPENDMQYLVDEFEKSLPPMGHPLRKLGVRLTELLDEDQWAECERLLLEGWEHDAADRATGARWRANYGEFAIEVAKLAVAAEREACAKACEEVDLHSGDHLKNSNPRVTCAAAIRAR